MTDATGPKISSGMAHLVVDPGKHRGADEITRIAEASPPERSARLALADVDVLNTRFI